MILAQRDGRAGGLRALLSVPLVVRDRIIGVFNCYKAQPHRFTDAETSDDDPGQPNALGIENANLVVRSAVIREMHHRVKNNLQTIAMLLRLQLRDGHEVSGREVLTETINRILSIASVHEILSVEGFRLINLRQLLERLAGHVTHTMSHPGRRLTSQCGRGCLPHVSAGDLPGPGGERTVTECLRARVWATPRGQIEIRIATQDAGLVLQVEDNGQDCPRGLTRGRAATWPEDRPRARHRGLTAR